MNGDPCIVFESFLPRYNKWRGVVDGQGAAAINHLQLMIVGMNGLH